MRLKKFTRKYWLILAALIPATAVAQTSFTNMASDLTDPSKNSGVALCVQDMNGDRLDDIVCLDSAKRIYIEYQGLDGAWTALDGPRMDNGNAWGMAAGDATNNGYGDIFSGLFGGRPDYAKANANGTSYTVSELPTYSLATQCVNLADMDGDGDIDFFSCGDTGPSGIWENDGNGNFSYSGDGIIPMTPTGGWDGSGNYGSTFTDFDLDGDLDLYISHCRQGQSNPNSQERINQVFLNDGNNNYTEDFSDPYNLRIGAQSWTTDFQDMDNDGDFDAFITNHDVDNMLLENVNNVFTDIFPSTGLDMSVGTPIQGLMRDFDNDMYVDVIVTGSDYAYYRNNGDKTFTKLPGLFGSDDMESLAVGDLNHDGFLDIYGGYAGIYTTPNYDKPDAVWMNDANDNHWIVVNLQGTISNRSAIGSVVRLYGPWGQQVREVRSGESYGISNSLQCHFGLGTNTAIDSVVIDWPSSGIHQVIENPIADQFLTVIENDCVAPETIITSSGPSVICAGQSLDLDAPTGAGYTYEWSTGATSASIIVNTPGTYMVHVTAPSGCDAVSAALLVEVSPDETPEVSVSGDLEFCEGESVMLTSTLATGYTWSNQMTGQSISVSEPGNYSVTIAGACADFTSESVTVSTLNAPAPSADDVIIPAPNTADLTATGTGSDFNWYTQATGGSPVGSGANWTTPMVNSNSTFYVEEVHHYGGGTSNGAKTDNTNSGGAYHNTTVYYNFFDVHENCTLKSVKVYTESAGNRTVYIEDSNGNLVYSQMFDMPSGESRIYFTNWDLVPGTDYRFRALDANHGMWRDDNSGAVSFPYSVGSLVTLTGTNTANQQYYYYYYDWEVEADGSVCISDRRPVDVTIDPAVSVEETSITDAIAAFPNPTSGNISIQFGQAVNTAVQVSISDIRGKTIFTEQINSVGANQIHELDLTDFAQGTYMLNVNTVDGNWTERIMTK
ncbi:MAG: hypothetical protein ACI9FU_000815 [Granulosicoccus sp.]|jgi:hypothetical protein